MRAAALPPTPQRRAQRLPWLALLLALAVVLPQSVASAQLPLHLQWLPSILPPAAVGPALKDFFHNMPTELCALGPKGISDLPVSVMDEVCPLKAANRLGRALPALRGLSEDAAIERLAAKPVTIGGALMLLAADDAAGAADLQKRICNVLLYPNQVCAFGSDGEGDDRSGSSSSSSSSDGGSSSKGSETGGSSSGPENMPSAADVNATLAADGVGPLHQHLEEQLPVQDWLASKVMPLALAPVGGTLAALPDALCKLPLDSLSNMPPKIKAQLCPYDVALVPVLALFTMGRARSGELQSKLCDIFKRPAEACANGSYAINDSTRKRIDAIKALGVSAVYSWEPDVPELPKLSFPDIDFTSPASRENFGKLASWWQNETMPTLRRYTMAAFVPPPLQAPVASLLERLPDSICATIGSKRLPFAFKREVCPISDVLQLKAGQGINSWAYTLAEVTIGAAGASSNSSESAKARVDAWLMRTCSAVYAPELACARDVAGREAGPDEGTMELLGQRIAARGPVSAELVRRSLESMPGWQRKRLVNGVALQLKFWSASAKLLPKSVAATMFEPFCGTNATEASIADKTQGIASLVAAAAVAANDAVQPLPALGAIVGEERARAAVAKLCDSLKPSPPPPPSRWKRASEWVKGALPIWPGAKGKPGRQTRT